MTSRDRLDTSLEFAQRSDREFDNGGNTMIAAELLWGALAHALITVAAINDWPCHGHRGYFQVARRLAEEQPDLPWQSDIAAADQLYRHFYNRNLSPGELDSRRWADQRALHRAIASLPTQ